MLALILVLVLAVAGGYIGSMLRGGGSETDNTAQGAFLKKIQDRGKLRVGIALSPPMTVQLKDGSYGGPNIIPLENLADELGVDLEPVPAEWNNIVAGMQADRYDFAASLDQTVARSMSITFTEPVWEYPAVFVVKADSSYKTAEDVIKDGRDIGTAQGTAPEASLKLQTKNVMAMKEYSNVVSALKADRVIAEFADYPTGLSQVQADESLKLIIPDPDIYLGKAAYGVPKDIDYRSLNVINVAIDRAKNENVLESACAKADYIPADRLGDSDLLGPTGSMLHEASAC